MPKRPEQAPASVSGPRFARSTPDRGRPTHARSTRPFRFGSEDRPDPDPPLEPGALVGERYRIVRLLGEGGMGRVYEAEHTVLSRRVALKLLRRDAQSQSENLARFRQEALAASRIGTAQIIEVVDFASHSGPAGVQTYMVMELLAGEGLEEWMDRNEQLDVGIELLAQLCDGLAAAHRAGVIHRDIKPANVFCQAADPGSGGGRSNIKILDFGIAKMADGGQSVQTQQGSLLGTPYYLAPERVLGNPLTPAADVYSVGVILYEMLTGNVPFMADSFMGILARHVHAEPLDPRQAAPDRAIPDSIASVCMRLLAKQPQERPSAIELAAELRGILARERTLLARVSAGPREGTASAGEDTQVLAGGVAEAISERPTLPPAMDGFAQAPRVEPQSRGRSGTAIGHAAVADYGAVIEPPTLTTAAPAKPTSTRATLWIAAAAVVIVIGGLGLGGYSLWRAQQEPVAVEHAPPAPPSSDAEPAERESIPAPPAAAVAEPAQGAVVEPPPVEPVEESPREPAGGSGKKPAKQPEKPAPEPDADPEPTPSEAEPPPPDTQVDPQLPTIKDDVYD